MGLLPLALDARLLRALRLAGMHIPAAELAREVGSPVPELRRAVASLSDAGFEIEERPGLGLRLIGEPDRLIADDLAARWTRTDFIREFAVFEETDSTNDLALQRGRDGAAGGLAIFAERQRAGRGRFGRRWESASHLGLWFSLLLRPDLPLAEWPRLTTWAAAGTAAALEAISGVRTRIKWPNDVFQEGKKIAGVLIESSTDVHGAPFAVVGIGINVRHEPQDFPAELAGVAGSLRCSTGRLLARPAVAIAVLEALAERASRLSAAFPELVTEAAERSLLLGHWIGWRAGTAVREGCAEALDEYGRLIVHTAEGLETLGAGEVTLLGAPRE